MLQRNSVNGSLLPAGTGSGLLPDPRELASGPIIVYGGTIHDVKAAFQADENKLISLEARLCGVSKERLVEHMHSNSNSRVFPGSTENNKKQGPPMARTGSFGSKVEMMDGDPARSEADLPYQDSYSSGQSEKSFPAQDLFMGTESHASKRKSMQPKKRSLRKADEMLSEIKRKKKKVEETPPAAPSPEQKQKLLSSRSKEKIMGGDYNTSSSPTPATLSATVPSSHNSTSAKKNGLEEPIMMEYVGTISKLKEEVTTLRTALEQKTKEEERLRIHVKKLEESEQQFTLHANAYKTRSQEAMKRYLIQYEEIQKSLKKKALNEKLLKYGTPFTYKSEMRFTEGWEEGEDITRARHRVASIKLERDEVDKQRKSLKGQLRQLKLENRDDNAIFECEKLIELASIRVANLAKEESKAREELRLLDIEKTLFAYEYYRFKAEEHSKYAGLSIRPNYEVLHHRYLILSLLGKGGYSEVYKAYDLESHIEVACKILQLDQKWDEARKKNYVRHAMREHEINETLNHSRIVKQFDTIEIDNTSFGIILELCDGPSLDIYLKQHGMLTEKEAKAIIWQILIGLKYLNDQPKKIIHYDLKPQNILFHRGEIKISDFGLAKIIEENKSNIELTSQGVGTYWYLPPECFDTGMNPTISPNVDIWSVGVIFYEMLYGAKPFGQNMTQERILKEDTIRSSGPVIFPERKDVSPECRSFISKCLERSPCNRMNVVQALETDYIKKGQKKVGGGGSS